MNCRYDDCEYYELWDSSYDDGEGHHDHRVCFCHHNGECGDNWNVDEENECPYEDVLGESTRIAHNEEGVN